MNSQNHIDIIQQGIDAGRSLHSKVVGDSVMRGVMWLSHKIFRTAGNESQTSAAKHKLKYS